jgi:hypothetical protein
MARPIEFEDVQHQAQRRYQSNWIRKNRERHLAINRASKRRRREQRHQPSAEVFDEELDRLFREALNDAIETDLERVTEAELP